MKHKAHWSHLKQKLDDPATKEKAELYYPKLRKIQRATTDLTKYIATLKQVIKSETLDSDNVKNKNKSINELFVNNNRYKELYKRLKQYKAQTFDTDSILLGRIKNYIAIISKEQDSIDSDNFLKQCFTDASPIEALTYLNRLENNISIAEIKCMQFYNENIRSHVHWFESYEAILGQNAKVLKAGDYLEISGGVGAFSKQRLLQFSVAETLVEPNEKGIAFYKFKTPKKLGLHSVPIHIRMLDQYNREQDLHFNVDYTLVNSVIKNNCNHLISSRSFCR